MTQTRDARGWRAKFAVLAPSTNTIVQPDCDDLRVPGVTNHYSRIFVENIDVTDNASFTDLTDRIARSVDDAVTSVLTCQPDYLVMGMSAVAFYGGLAGAHAFRDKLQAKAGIGVSTGALSTAEAMKRLGVKRLSFLSPYFPVANAEVRRFYTEYGFEVLRDECLRCPTPVAIAHEPPERLREVIARLDGPDVDAIVQVGTNLSMVSLAASAEAMLGKPVIAINTATYWHALRSYGIDDKVYGFGSLLERF